MAEYHERYQRQGLIKGWDQEKLTKGKVVIIGGGILSEFVNLGLAALGVGELRLLTNKENGKTGILKAFNKYTEYVGSKQVTMMSSVLEKINKTIDIIDINSELTNENSLILLNKPNLIIDTTNNLKSKLLCSKYSKENRITFITGSANEMCGIVDVNPNQKKLGEYRSFANKEQNMIISEVIAGFIIDETRKVLLPLNKTERSCKKTLMYNLTSVNRFGE